MKNIQARRSIKNLALTLVLGLAVVGLSQCRMVEDTLTGVELNTPDGVNARSECVKACNEEYKAASRAEEERHKAANRACRSEKVCKKAEKSVNKANKDRIKDAKDDCKRACYNEGSGGGGR